MLIILQMNNVAFFGGQRKNRLRNIAVFCVVSDGGSIISSSDTVCERKSF